MSRCLITGSAGFIGRHLAVYLRDAAGLDVYGLIHHTRPEDAPSFAGQAALSDSQCIQGDVTDPRTLAGAVARSRPQWVFHLAARSGIQESWTDPAGVFATNVTGTLHLLEALRTGRLDPPPTVVLAGSSAEYGVVRRREPIREDEPPRPSTPYGVSKTVQDRLAEAYGSAHGVRIVRVRPFHVTGPGNADVCARFARDLVSMAGRPEPLPVGHLDMVRDIVDVRDAVTALWVLAQRGMPGEVYNLSSGAGRTIREILEGLMALSGTRPTIVHDPARVRPVDDAYLVGDNSKLTALGWRPRIGPEQTLGDILDFWHARAAGPAPSAATAAAEFERR